MTDAARAAAGPIEQSVAVFMLHPETLAGSVAAGYTNPLAGYVAGRGGVLGEISGEKVAEAFTVFEPDTVRALWEQGVAVRGAAGAAEVYWNQTAEFARTHLADGEGLDRIAELGEKVIAATPPDGLPLYGGWRAMPLAEDPPARALQVMFVLRELRGDVHFGVLKASGIHPVEAHMLNKGPDYVRMFGWSEPFADGADKKAAYAEVEKTTDALMSRIFAVALTLDEAQELAELTGKALGVIRRPA